MAFEFPTTPDETETATLRILNEMISTDLSSNNTPVAAARAHLNLAELRAMEFALNDALDGNNESLQEQIKRHVTEAKKIIQQLNQQSALWDELRIEFIILLRKIDLWQMYARRKLQCGRAS